MKSLVFKLRQSIFLVFNQLSNSKLMVQVRLSLRLVKLLFEFTVPFMLGGKFVKMHLGFLLDLILELLTESRRFLSMLLLFATLFILVEILFILNKFIPFVIDKHAVCLSHL